ncbi:MAG: selenocysteine-specific translation elongation factor [candidate division Zixibacteria bacterium]|nr:selenocysteine-specific translation elongation factor [candidate division Zixibacteria bacterium]
MIIVGTAGHIDHGKSSIVKRLTGTDPDRLPEEKARGMTIDLGFAFYHTPSGEEIGFVDVPGHERFVKNMIAGAGGMDVVMLVVAADDGWMPQSQEHFQIIKLLGVRHGVVVINKIDLATPDWLNMIEQDIREKVKDSFLADAPFFRVSANTGSGFDELGNYLNALPQRLRGKSDIGKARLYIDRSFIRPGIGGVVTGTLRGGALSVGQPVSVWPNRATGKIRSLQSAGRIVDTAHPGQRTAVAVTGIEKELLVRGGVICDRTDTSFIAEHQVFALYLQMLPEALVPLEDRRRVFVMVGTSEVEGEVRLFGSERIPPGGSGIVFVRPDQPLYALAGDRFILRLPTPMVTLGGGKVLDHLEHFPRRRDLPSLDYLRKRLGDNLSDWIESELEKCLFVLRGQLMEHADVSFAEVSAIAEKLLADKNLFQFGDYLCHAASIEREGEEVSRLLGEELGRQPHLKGLTADWVAAAINRPLPLTRTLLDYLVSAGVLTATGDLFNVAGRGLSIKGVIKEAHDKMMSELKTSPYAPPTLEQLASRGKVFQQAIAFMIDSGEVYKCGADYLFLMPVWLEIVSFVKSRLTSGATLAVGDLKERFGLTRKWAIPILEETDRIRLTQRQGDVRIKGDRFDA